MQMKVLWITNIDFGERDQRLIKFSISSRYWRKMEVHQVFVDFKKPYNSDRWEVLHNILFKFGIPRKLAGLIKMCLNETYRTERTGKHQSDKFPIQNGSKHGDALSPLLCNTPLGGSKMTRKG
jgi:hypothetical protein